MDVETLDKITNLANTLLKDHNLEGWRFKWGNSKRRLGMCSFKEKTIEVSLWYVGSTSDEELEDTVRHEIAHAVVGSGHGHDYVWKRAAIQLGARPQSCAPDHVQSAAQPNYIIECSNCKKRWERFRLRKELRREGVKSSCCHAPLTFYRVKRG